MSITSDHAVIITSLTCDYDAESRIREAAFLSALPPAHQPDLEPVLKQSPQSQNFVLFRLVPAQPPWPSRVSKITPFFLLFTPQTVALKV